MKKHALRCSTQLGALAISAALGLGAPARAGSLVNITDINVPGADASTTTPYAVNNAGVIAGQYLDPAVGYRVFALMGGTYSTVDPGPAIAENGSYFVSLNNSGQIVGFANTSTPPNFGYYYLAPGGGSPLATFPAATATLPSGVTGFSGFNDSGAIAGETATGGFVSSAGAITIVNPPTSTSTVINAINDSGDVVGQFDPAVPTNPLVNQEAFVEMNGIYTILTPPNSQFVEATGINDAGEVVGYFEETPVDGPGGFPVTPILGFTYDKGVYTSYGVPGEIETELFGLNDSGEVVGYFSDEDGDASGFSANAVPEPAAWTLMLGGFAMIGSRLRRRAATLAKPARRDVFR